MRTIYLLVCIFGISSASLAWEPPFLADTVKAGSDSSASQVVYCGTILVLNSFNYVHYVITPGNDTVYGSHVFLDSLHRIDSVVTIYPNTATTTIRARYYYTHDGRDSVSLTYDFTGSLVSVRFAYYRDSSGFRIDSIYQVDTTTSTKGFAVYAPNGYLLRVTYLKNDNRVSEYVYDYNDNGLVRKIETYFDTSTTPSAVHWYSYRTSGTIAAKPVRSYNRKMVARTNSFDLLGRSLKNHRATSAIISRMQNGAPTLTVMEPTRPPTVGGR